MFKGLLWRNTIVYLDDILVFSVSPEAHLSDLREVMNRINGYGLKMNFKKCQFGVQKVEFLGYIVENGDMRIKEEQRNKLLQFRIPRNPSELRSLLEFTAFFKKFVPDYTTIVTPLLERLKRDNFKIGSDEERAIEKIRESIVNSQAIILRDPRARFYLNCDASGDTIGGALKQLREGKERVVMWMSRRLLPAELNYTVTEKECLAVVWCVERSKVYLVNQFTIRTDHSALK